MLLLYLTDSSFSLLSVCPLGLALPISGRLGGGGGFKVIRFGNTLQNPLRVEANLYRLCFITRNTNGVRQFFDQSG